MIKKLFSVAVILSSLAAVAVTSGPCWAQTAPATPPQGIAAAVQPFVDNHTLAGVVTLVASPDKVLDLEAVGYTDIAAKKPMRTDCVFWIASQSKPITSTALMILVDEGKVKLDDPVEKYLPEFKGQMVAVERDKDHVLLRKPKHPITVKNVLSHTSGLPFKSPIEEPTLDLYSLAVRVRSYAMGPLEFEPDKNYRYANAGVNTAGRIIEVVSGMPYEKFLDERIFKPLGMKDTTFWPKGEQLERLAKSYLPEKGGLRECPIAQLKYPLDDPERQPMPAGGLFSTATDLSIFYRMLAHGGIFAGHRIVSAEAVKQMTSKQTGELKPSYGLAFSTSPTGFGHGGAYHTKSNFDKEHQLITIFLVQDAGSGKDGPNLLLPAFEKAAVKLFASPACKSK